MAGAADLHIMSIVQLLLAIGILRYAGASEKLTEGGKFGATFDDDSGVKFEDQSRNRVTVHSTAKWVALGKVSKLSVTRYKL